MFGFTRAEGRPAMSVSGRPHPSPKTRPPVDVSKGGTAFVHATRYNIGERMKIAEGSVVTLAYDINDASGEIIESSEISGLVTFLQGRSGLIPGLDRRLVGMEQGQEATFSLPPEEAFGRLQDAPRQTLPITEVPSSSPKVGDEYEAALPGGQAVRLRVLEVSRANVTVAVMHPLAGQTIEMHVKIVALREATAAERQAGTVISRPPPVRRAL